MDVIQFIYSFASCDREQKRRPAARAARVRVLKRCTLYFVHRCPRAAVEARAIARRAASWYARQASRFPARCDWSHAVDSRRTCDDMHYSVTQLHFGNIFRIRYRAEVNVRRLFELTAARAAHGEATPALKDQPGRDECGN